MTKSSSNNSFYKYMIRYYKNAFTSFGDFTRDMIEDKTFPRRKYPNIDEYIAIRRHLENMGAHVRVIDVFVDAYHEYERSTLSK